MEKITFIVKEFKDLSLQQLYDVLALRDAVFTVEQDAAYLDVDGKDSKALHILGLKKNDLVAYARAFRPNDYFEKASIGRVVVSQIERKNGYGNLLMQESIKAVKQYFLQTTIQISAQKHLQHFYESHGFKTFGKEYLEDGIPHIGMLVTV